VSVASKIGSGRNVVFTAAMQDDDGTGPSYVIDYGDGTTKSVPAPSASCAGSGRTAKTPFDITVTLEHRYAKGTYAAQIEVTSGGGSCQLPAAETQTAYALVTIP